MIPLKTTSVCTYFVLHFSNNLQSLYTCCDFRCNANSIHFPIYFEIEQPLRRLGCLRCCALAAVIVPPLASTFQRRQRMSRHKGTSLVTHSCPKVRGRFNHALLSRSTTSSSVIMVLVSFLHKRSSFEYFFMFITGFTWHRH